ncbi:ribonuclease HII [Desulfurobacterium pacificum]|uniref:ribonuclease HII n=1 Tax=Desulfurobacterium pacificum TaxID=240166 RepID=UPI0024B76C67|nr:ribonuclease HII [Desulfurobacterium pacificum]
MDDQQVILKFERELWNKGYKRIAGIDEAGRGPLAGPVVAAVVVFPPNVNPFLFKDSKKLKESERENLFYEIVNSCLDFSVGFADSLEIDSLNIYKATLLAVHRALKGLKEKPDFLITDYLKVEGYEENSLVLVKGDERSFSCACASVLAKVTRDYIMKSFEEIFPGYDFSSNKGYPTKKHIAAIDKMGITPIHRGSFGRVKGKRVRRGKDSFPLPVEERLRYYREKLQELLGRD